MVWGRREMIKKKQRQKKEKNKVKIIRGIIIIILSIVWILFILGYGAALYAIARWLWIPAVALVIAGISKIRTAKTGSSPTITIKRPEVEGASTEARPIPITNTEESSWWDWLKFWSKTK